MQNSSKIASPLLVQQGRVRYTSSPTSSATFKRAISAVCSVLYHELDVLEEIARWSAQRMCYWVPSEAAGAAVWAVSAL